MKKLKTLLTLAMVALMSLSFTSCDEDANTAYYLDGTWRGNMYVNSSYNDDDWDDLDWGYWGYSSISGNSPIVVDTRAAEGKDSTQYVRWFDKEDK